MMIVILSVAKHDQRGNDMLITGMFLGIGLNIKDMFHTVNTENSKRPINSAKMMIVGIFLMYCMNRGMLRLI